MTVTFFFERRLLGLFLYQGTTVLSQVGARTMAYRPPKIGGARPRLALAPCIHSLALSFRSEAYNLLHSFCMLLDPFRCNHKCGTTSSVLYPSPALDRDEHPNFRVISTEVGVSL